MVVDSTLAFAARRNVPTRYNRNLVATTLKAMQRVSEVRARRERAFYKQRMQGNRERAMAADRKLVEENQHLLPPGERDAPPFQNIVDAQLPAETMDVEGEWQGLENTNDMDQEAESLQTTISSRAPKVKTAMKLKVGGGMDID